MLDRVIAFSLKNRLLVLAAALGLVLYGGWVAMQLPIDVFPDLNRPTVTVLTEAPGLAPEEVETLVTFPLEAALNGATGVQRVRSASGIGLSVIWVEFDWDTDIFLARQIVDEKLELVRSRLPQGIFPTMAPVTSIMGEIMLIGMTAKGPTTAMELRTLADWVVATRLRSVEGIAQVTVLGGEIKQYQVLTSPQRLAQYDVTLDELTRAVERSNTISGGGFLLEDQQESLIRIVGRARSLEDVASTVIRPDEPVSLTVGLVADVVLGGPVARGDASIDGRPAVILSVQKQPGADTLALTEALERTLEELRSAVPEDVQFRPDLFRQADFIQRAVGNVQEAVRDGVLWVVVVLFVFLWNFRISLVTLTAIPLSLIGTALVFRYFGISINTMTLGGLAVAIGELVDDSIVDAENIYRRLKENRRKARPAPALWVVLRASSEIRNSIVYATAVVVLVVFPLFSLSGLEGRMFAPLGLSYLVTLVASLLVSLTVTPALASLLLPGAKFLDRPQDPFVLRWLKRADTLLLRFTLRHSGAILVVVGVLVAASLGSLAWMGGEFLPDFNEGTLTITATAPPGTSLKESNRLGTLIEQRLLEVPEVRHVSRRTGRAELDEHAMTVNTSEMEVELDLEGRPKPGWSAAVLRALPGLHHLGMEHTGRPREEVLNEIRDLLSEMPGVVFNIGQPISHRLDHMVSGIRAEIAVKIFGPDLEVLRDKAHAVLDLMREVPGVVDLQAEPQVEIPQVRVTVRRDEALRYGLQPADVSEALETALQGRVVSEVLEEQRLFDLLVWFDETSRHDLEQIRSTQLSTPGGGKVTLGTVAEVRRATGPNTIHREDVLRRLVVQANTAGRDLAGVVADVQRAIDQHVPLPPGYFIEIGGQFEAQQAANLRLLVLGSVSLAAIFLLLYKALGDWRAALQVMVNIPLAALGAIVMLWLVNRPSAEALHEAPWWEWPRVWASATTLSVAHWVGFITLVGIVSRNGIMMISHYLHLMEHEGEDFGPAMIIRGSLERLAPVLMTALTTIMGLVPLALGAGQPGKEILHPLAIVVIGGLLMSTLLDQVVTPALFLRYGSKIRRGRQADVFAQPQTDTEAAGPGAAAGTAGG